MKSYSIFSNILYVYKDLARYSKRTIVNFILSILFSIIAPLSLTLVSTVVVYALTNHLEISKYLLYIGLIILVALISQVIKFTTSETYKWDSTFTRCSIPWIRLSEKEISTDYLNIEPRDKQEIVKKGFLALDSNWIGFERISKETPKVIIDLMGMIVYGVLVSIYVPYILIVLFFMIGTSLLLGVWIYKYRAKHQDEYEKLNTQLRVISTDTTGLDNAKDIRIYRLENWFLRVYDKLIEKNTMLDKGYYRLNFFIGASNSLYEFIRDAVAYFILIILVINRTIDVTTFTFLIGIVAGFSSWSNEFTDSYNELRVANVLMNDYRHALSIEDKMNHDKGIDIKSLSYPLDIKFDHVYFRYPNSDKDVLKDINFEIAPKEKIAIVGNNGAGKTTLIKLLCGLYLPTSGNILINGHRIEEFNIDDYMDLISAVFQDVNPLALTIKENIACCTNHSFDEKKMWDALEKAGLKEKVESFKDKENTFITETFDLSGIRLSGGETQKLMLARALYKDGKLLILDEPTSALDPLSEEKMYKQYLDFTKDNTSIFISHRLASTKFCDQIIFLKDGVIEEVGTHQELIKNNKLYKEMFDIQAKYYKENKGENDTL